MAISTPSAKLGGPATPPRTDPAQRIAAWLFAPIDIGPVAYFRILFGLVMLYEAYRYFSSGWIHRFFIQPRMHFQFYGFEWVRPWPGAGMYVHFAVLGAAALMFALGLFYRTSAVVLFLSFTYVFLLDEALYLNHFYLMCLLSFLAIFLPAHREWSLDAVRRPALHSETAPAWTLNLLRTQLAIVYFYAGLAKLNADWLRGEPIRTWLAQRADRPVIGPLLAEEWVALTFAYGGLLLDLFVVPALLWRKTRLPAFLAATLFHILNGMIFTIGVFPWLMLAATPLFFPVDWWTRFLRGRDWLSGQTHPPPEQRGHRALTAALLGTYMLIQVLVPLRHFLYPGNVSWTEEGHRFAWHMKLRSKVPQAVFIVTDPVSGREVRVDPRERLERWQARKMPAVPDMILQFAHFLADEWQQETGRRPEVRVKSSVSLNGRKPQPLIDPARDLAAVRRSLRPADWIVPLNGTR